MTDDKLTPGDTSSSAEPQEAQTPAAENPEVAPTAPEASQEASADSPATAPATEESATPQASEPDPAPASPEPQSESKPSTEGKTEDEMLFEAALSSLSSEEGSEHGLITKGDRIVAEVVQVENDRVFVNLGTKAEGIVPLAELSHEKIESALGHVQRGDKFEVIVLNPRGSEGSPVVSKKRADFDVQWQRILDSFEEGKVFEANVVDRVKGGLVVDIGVRGFVPATHVGSGKLRNIEKFVGETLSVKIIEVDRERKKVVLSNKAAEDERREEVREQIFSKVRPGEVLEGTVRRLTDYGAFVDLGGVDGLLHISEMSWIRIDHPREVLKEGDEIKVMVLRLDEGGGRISLGLRQVLPDPWNLIRDNYKLGDKIQTTVSRMVQAGAFVRLPEGAEAFLPVSEVSDERVKKPQDVLEDGQAIEPTIIDLRPDERRMVLSLRTNPQVGGYRMDPSVGAQMRSPHGGGQGGKRRPGGGGKFRPVGEADATPAQRTATGGATIGERLGLLKGLVRNENEESAPAESSEETKE